MPKKKHYLELLAGYLPEEASDTVAQWLCEYRAEIRISRPRATKLADYRHPHKGKPHRISINGNLNKQAFLITLVHEMAHMETYTKHKTKARPHGHEWKDAYRVLLSQFLSRRFFSEEVLAALKPSIKNPSASVTSEYELSKALMQHDVSKRTLLEELPPKSYFSIRPACRSSAALQDAGGNRVFQKGEKLRKRYKCKEIKTGKYFFVSPLAVVEPVNP